MVIFRRKFLIRCFFLNKQKKNFIRDNDDHI